MLVFVRLSERRFQLIDVDAEPRTYMAAEGVPDKGYPSAHYEKVGEPCSWSDAHKAATAYCIAKGRLVTYADWSKRHEKK